MEPTSWLKQGSEPLFPDILWSRPESKAGAGKLAIIGGNAHGFSAPGTAYSTALQGGAGVVRVILPDGLRKLVGAILPDADFTTSTPSGSFARASLADLLSLAAWGDAVLLAGDVGRNSETAIVLESLIQKYTGLLIITHDAVDYFKETPKQLIDREHTLVVLSLAQLQKFFINTPTIMPIMLSMSTLQLVDALQRYTAEHPAGIVTKHNDLVFVAQGGRVSTTKHDEKIWRVDTAARASVFWLQNPSKQFEAVTSALVR